MRDKEIQKVELDLQIKKDSTISAVYAANVPAKKKRGNTNIDITTLLLHCISIFSNTHREMIINAKYVAEKWAQK